MIKYFLFLIPSLAFGQFGSLSSNYDQQFLKGHVPRNYVKNSGAEKSNIYVTQSVSILTRTTTTPIRGYGSFLVNATAASQTLDWTTETMDTSDIGKACLATIEYNGDATLYQFSVIDGSSNTISDTITLSNISSNSQTAELGFTCVSGAKVRIASTGNGAEIRVDDVYLGKDYRLGVSRQSELVVYARRASSNQSIATTSATTIVFNTEDIDLYSEFDSSTGVFTAKRAGRYVVTGNVRLDNYTAGERVQINVVTTGSSGGCYTSMTQPTTTAPSTTLTGCTIDLDVGETIHITSDSDADSSYDIDSSVRGTWIQISKFPGANETVVRGNVSDLTGTAKYAGTTNCAWSTTSASRASFAADTDCPTMTVSGNLVAPGTKIPAAVAPKLLPGKYLVVVQADFVADPSSSGTQTCYYDIYDGTTRGGQVKLQQAVTTYWQQYPVITGLFEYTATQSNIQFEVRGERAGGNGSCYVNNGNANGTDFHIALIPLSQPVTKPFIPGSVFAGRANVVKIGTAVLNCDSGSAITTNTDSMISSIGNVSSGACSITLATGYFSSTPRCFAQDINTASTPVLVSAVCSSSTACSIDSANDAGTASTAYDVNLFCIGNN